MGNRKILRGYMRVDKKGNPIPGHTVLRQKQPTGMNFKPLVDPSTYVCCDPFAPTGTDCSVGGYWISREDNLDSPPQVNVDYFNSVSDSNCNIYTLWNYIIDTPQYYYLVEKRDSAGTMLWQKTYTIPLSEEVTYSPKSFNIVVDSNNNIILFGNGFITKIDGAGAVLWNTFYTGPAEISILSGGNVDAENNLVINGNVSVYSPEIDAVVKQLYVAKFNGDTGAVIAEKYFYDINQETSDIVTYSVPWTDGTDIYVLPTGFYSDGINPKYQGVALKLDSTLTEVWNTKVLNSDVIAGDQDGTAIRVFPDGGVLLTTYGEAIIKLDSAGNFVWCSYSSGTYLDNAVVASDGSVYQFGESSNTPSGLSIVHFKADGTFDWAYNLTNPTDGVGTWPVIPQQLVYKNNVLYLNQPKNTLKLPLTQVPDGTYGNYTIVSDTYIYTNPVVPMTSTTLTPYTTTTWADNSINPVVIVADTTFTQTNSTI